MIILKGFLTILVLLLPLFVGFCLNRKTLSETYLYGQVLFWGIFQLIAVPMVYFRATFNALFIVFCCVLAGLVAWGIRKAVPRFVSWKKGFSFRDENGKLKLPFQLNVFFILASLVILYQACIYIFKMHLDEDDARWIAEANDALVKNRMLLHNPATGEYIGRFVGEMVKDVFSPWSMHLAVISRLSMIRPVVMAHTVYAPVLLLLSYNVYTQMGKRLFKGKSEQGIFLLMVSVINLFMAGNVYTQSVFTLTRIWQGKAAIAAIIIPLILLLLLEIEQEDTVKNWLLLVCAGFAACLMSGMGIAISVIMIAVYGGYAVICKRFKRIPLYLLALAPPIVYGLLYFRMKG